MQQRIKDIKNILNTGKDQKLFWKFLLSPIEEFYKKEPKKISTRTYNSLKISKHNNVFDCMLELENLTDLRQFGDLSLEEVKKLLYVYGIDTSNEIDFCFVKGYILTELNKPISECPGLYSQLKKMFDEKLTRLDADYGPRELFNCNKLFDLLRKNVHFGIFSKEGRFSKPEIQVYDYIYQVEFEVLKYLKEKYKF